MINNNRQAGRRRGRGGQQQRPQGNSGGVRDNGNRIDNRSRGNAAQLLEKYKALARDSQMSGDRVNTEYYLQFADHYFRVLAETRSRFEENNRPPQQGGANTFQDDETEYDDDGAPIVAEPSRQNGVQQNGNQNYQGDRQERPDRQERQDRQDRQVSDRQVSDRQTSDRQDRPERPDRQVNDRGQQGDDRPRRSNGNGSGNVNNAGTSYGNEGERYVRDDRGSRNEGRNEGRPEGRPASRPESRNEGRGNRTERYQSEDRAPVQHEAVVESAPVVDEQPVEAPRRRGRPRREPVAEAPVAFDSAILPPSLNISAVTPTNIDSAPANDATGDELEEKPRRRRGRPPASETSTAG